MTREKAHELRRLIVKASASLPDEDALNGIELFDEWFTDTDYERDDRRRYEGKLYKCLQNHKSQADWTPDVATSLWVEVAEPGTIPVWKQPVGSEDAYRLGDQVHYPTADDPVYESDIDYNTYAPDVYGWHLV